MQQNLKPQTHNPTLNSQTNTQSFNQTGQMIELCCESLSVYGALTLCFYHITYTVGVILHSVIAWMSSDCVFEEGLRPNAIPQISDMPVLSKESLDIEAITECRFTLRMYITW